MTAPLLDVRGLRKFFPIAKGMFRARRRPCARGGRRRASPCRKARRSAWWARAAAARPPPRAASCAPSIRPTDRCCTARATTRSSISRRCRRRELGPLRNEIQMIFQDPFGSLNPRMTLFDNVGEPLLVNGMRNRRERDGPRGRTAAPGRAAAGVHASLPARVQRRAAPAHRHRARAGHQSAAGGGRRAGLGARCVGAGAGAEPAAGAAIAAAADLPVRRARPVGGAPHLRPRRGDVCRAAGRAGDRPMRCSAGRGIPIPRR